MNLKFTLNEYVLIWNLLFRKSFSTELNNRKQKIWVNYQKEYQNLEKELKLIYQDSKNYIPDDDTIYNVMKEEDIYQTIYHYTDKYRLELAKTYEEYKKDLSKELKSILKIPFRSYNILLVDPRLNLVDYTSLSTEDRYICYGIKGTGSLETIMDLIYRIVRKETLNYNKEYQDVVDAVLELCLLNEFPTRITGKSYYLVGDKSLDYLKKQIYPYFLMYLGIEDEDISNFMKRDGILFDKDRYPYQKELKKMDLFHFIDFCIQNQRDIVKIEEIEITY